MSGNWAAVLWVEYLTPNVLDHVQRFQNKKYNIVIFVLSIHQSTFNTFSCRRHGGVLEPSLAHVYNVMYIKHIYLYIIFKKIKIIIQ